jgi:hypothetical protein
MDTMIAAIVGFSVGLSMGVWITALIATRIYGKKLAALAQHAAGIIQASYALSE